MSHSAHHISNSQINALASRDGVSQTIVSGFLSDLAAKHAAGETLRETLNRLERLTIEKGWDDKTQAAIHDGIEVFHHGYHEGHAVSRVGSKEHQEHRHD